MRAAQTSPQALANYLRAFDTGASADTMHGDPSIGGRFFYNEDLSGLNFERNSVPLVRSLDRLLELLDDPSASGAVRGRAGRPRGVARLRASQRARAGRGHRAASVAQQPCHGADALRHLLQPRLRRGRPAALHAVSAGAAREPVRRPARIHARGPAHQHGAARCARPRALSAFPRRARRKRRSPRWNRAMRCSSPTCGGITSKPSTPSTCWSTTGGMTRRRGMARRSKRCAMH